MLTRAVVAYFVQQGSEGGMQTPAVTYAYDVFARLTKVDNGNLWEIVGFDPILPTVVGMGEGGER